MQTSLPCVIVAVGAFLLSAPQAHAVVPRPLDKPFFVPHEASYDISLKSARSGSSVMNIRGSMRYEWKKACDAWITDHAFKLLYDYTDGPAMAMHSLFSTVETFDGQQLDFSTQRKRDGEAFEYILGHATLAGGPGTAGEAVLRQPEAQTHPLPAGTLFPTAHTAHLIDAATGGKKFVTVDVYDGTDREGPVRISSYIVRPLTGEERPQKESIESSLIDPSIAGWLVRMSFFPETDKPQADYEMTMALFANGLIGDMIIDYDDFSIRQTLSSAKPLVPADCVHPANSF